MLVGVIGLSGSYGIYGPAFGVFIGSMLHLIIQIPMFLKTGFKYKLSFDFKSPGMLEMLYLVPPRILGVLIVNAADTISNSLAILISGPSVVFLRFANQLQSFPVNLVGLSMASASLPILSSEVADNNMERFKKTFVTSLLQMFYLTLPLSVILLILRVPAIRIVYGAPNFPWWATVSTAYTLAFFSVSVFFSECKTC
jgi:putative peptidoglycan lipid II flippase